MKQRLADFMTMQSTDVKKKREDFMVSLRRRRKQELFQVSRSKYNSSIKNEYTETCELYKQDLNVLGITQSNDRSTKIDVLVKAITTSASGK